MTKTKLLLSALIIFLSCSSDDEELQCGVFDGTIALYEQSEINEFGKCNYTAVTGSLKISDFHPQINDQSQILNLSPLKSLTSIGGTLIIENMRALKSLKGLENLTALKSIRISNNSELESINSLKKIQFNGHLEFANNPLLENFDDFVIESIRLNGIHIINCPLISDLDTFKNITEVTGSITIEGIHGLTELSGLHNIESIGKNNGTQHASQATLTIVGNQNLQSLDDFSNLTSVNQGISIYGNTNLKNISGLSNVSTFVGDLEIFRNNNLSSISGLSSITEIKELRIYSNPLLTSLEGLSNVSKVDNKLYISSNSNLVNFCAIENLVINDGICCGYNSYNISGNAYNPSRNDIANGRCNQ